MQCRLIDSRICRNGSGVGTSKYVSERGIVKLGGSEEGRGHNSSMQRARRLGEISLTGIANAS